MIVAATTFSDRSTHFPFALRVTYRCKNRTVLPENRKAAQIKPYIHNPHSRGSILYYCIYHSSCLHDHFCLWFDDRDGSVTKYINRIKIPPAIRLSDEGKEQLMTLLVQLSDLDTDPLFKLSKLIDLLTLFGDGKPLSNGTGIERPQKIIDILAYIDEHYKEIRTSTELADTFFISQSTLNRLFRKYVGLSVFQIIDARRLSHAENLLRNGSSVMDACFQSGFTDCSKFIILFKKTFGVTPLRYKQTLFRS